MTDTATAGRHTGAVAAAGTAKGADRGVSVLSKHVKSSSKLVAFVRHAGMAALAAMGLAASSCPLVVHHACLPLSRLASDHTGHRCRAQGCSQADVVVAPWKSLPLLSCHPPRSAPRLSRVDPKEEGSSIQQHRAWDPGELGTLLARRSGSSGNHGGGNGADAASSSGRGVGAVPAGASDQQPAGLLLRGPCGAPGVYAQHCPQPPAIRQ